ncbi:hypothetical protein ACJ73_09214 [Blastomyces percursus]|uniref:Uncharacterized protein n=1 Tax=Blastomyces percursus TaxID=1658174 RepID=A0A1J9QDS8_9EURO|nr:hypothetical protein ACJ73_09214 [Blastomyces percursus]
MKEVVQVKLDVGGNVLEKVFLYVAKQLNDCDVILGTTWVYRQGVVIDVPRDVLRFDTGQTIKRDDWERKTELPHISAAAYSRWVTKHKTGKAQVFKASVADIQKALEVKKKVDPRAVLPEQYHEFLDVFDRKEADKLPPFRDKRVDFEIEL